MSERILCVAAHADDESFGCLGTLLKHKQAGDSVTFQWFTENRNTLEGAVQVARLFNSEFYFYAGFKDQQLDVYPLKEVIAKVEHALWLAKPTIVYCPFIGDLNKDHRVVSEATQVACRPYLPNAPREVWMYQINGTTELGFREFKKNRKEVIDLAAKFKLLKQWYPNELIHGRENVCKSEYFEKWPR